MRRDDALLLDMLLALQKIERFTQGLDLHEFHTNDLVQSAVIREFQVLGEAARLASQEIKSRYPAIPWKLIAGMRNRLIHEYFDIRLDTVWTTIQRDLPQLTAVISEVIASQGSTEQE
ncbi:MAG: DUF86 domain-containing protein [Candidatus Viridilinea halotolerans]|uniref:DUF86 domain-containing protein n=1 Tax=Candidatus Viridilinea halotolerans TaxID=2491704 RepID=A0A426TYC6_9CHLR|nr:MAG: DUF86 domain-containing protein [Candidatus Viridilinea halotolerans]